MRNIMGPGRRGERYRKGVVQHPAAASLLLPGTKTRIKSSGVRIFRCVVSAVLLALAVPALAAEPVPPYTPSSDPRTAADQQAAYELVSRYETLLNAGDTSAILALFTTDGVAEWNNVPTASTDAQRRAIYEALFRTAKFSTVFGYASVQAYGDLAVVRTYHHEGATVLENGKKVVDLNREVFVLRKSDGAYRILLYIFNTNPVQGEG